MSTLTVKQAQKRLGNMATGTFYSFVNGGVLTKHVNKTYDASQVEALRRTLASKKYRTANGRIDHAALIAAHAVPQVSGAAKVVSAVLNEYKRAKGAARPPTTAPTSTPTSTPTPSPPSSVLRQYVLPRLAAIIVDLNLVHAKEPGAAECCATVVTALDAVTRITIPHRRDRVDVNFV